MFVKGQWRIKHRFCLLNLSKEDWKKNKGPCRHFRRCPALLRQQLQDLKGTEKRSFRVIAFPKFCLKFAQPWHSFMATECIPEDPWGLSNLLQANPAF